MVDRHRYFEGWGGSISTQNQLLIQLTNLSKKVLGDRLEMEHALGTQWISVLNTSFSDVVALIPEETYTSVTDGHYSYNPRTRVHTWEGTCKLFSRLLGRDFSIPFAGNTYNGAPDGAPSLIKAMPFEPAVSNRAIVITLNVHKSGEQSFSLTSTACAWTHRKSN